MFNETFSVQSQNISRDEVVGILAYVRGARSVSELQVKIRIDTGIKYYGIVQRW